MFASFKKRRDEVEQLGISLAYATYFEMLVTVIVVVTLLACKQIKPINDFGTLSNTLAEDSKSIEMTSLQKLCLRNVE